MLLPAFRCTGAQGRRVYRRRICQRLHGHHSVGLLHAAHHSALRRPDGAGAGTVGFSADEPLFQLRFVGLCADGACNVLCGSDDLSAKQCRQMAAGAASDPWRIFHKLSAVADVGHLSSGQSRMDRSSGVRGLVCLFLPGGNSIVSAFLA